MPVNSFLFCLLWRRGSQWYRQLKDTQRRSSCDFISFRKLIIFLVKNFLRKFITKDFSPINLWLMNGRNEKFNHEGGPLATLIIRSRIYESDSQINHCRIIGNVSQRPIKSCSKGRSTFHRKLFFLNILVLSKLYA